MEDSHLVELRVPIQVQVGALAFFLGRLIT